MSAFIQFSHVSKRYGQGKQALEDITLDIEAGEWLFLAGHSGAGKTTLMKLIAAIETPTRGQLLFAGRNITKLSTLRIPSHRRRLGMVFQDHLLIDQLSVFENVALPLRVQGFGQKDIGKRVRAALDQVELLSRENDVPIKLSTGEQQRVGIARAIVHRPDVLIADEPTGNLDPKLSYDIMRLFKRFNDVGMTVLIATHDMDLIKDFNQRTILLDQGRLRADNPAMVSHA